MATGCAAADPASPGPATAGLTSTAAGTPTSGTDPARSAQTAQQQAAADASAILASFVPPPGATRVASAPPILGGWQLDGPSSTIVSSSLADHVAWWVAPGQPQQVLAWEVAHLPRRFTPGDTSEDGTHRDEMFSLPPVPGVLLDRELIVEVAGDRGGKTGIRVDGQVAWQPPRPATDLVPATARVVTLSEVAVDDPHPKVPAPVTITNANVAWRIAALANGLPLSTMGGASCPAPMGNELMLTFRASAGGPVLATAQGPGDCNMVQFTLDGQLEPVLQGTGSFTQDVLAAAGLRWAVP
ncbi:MAG: hypothetical protein JWM19_1160 [Actinomycetia bacterium]|nr:hypothetical protein [Actinomycetes bacterium]